MKLTCNYAIARFLPYAVTEEFVNIGVLLHCHETGFLDFRLTNRRKRITGFFPELDGALYRDAFQAFRDDLQAAIPRNHDSRQMLLPGQGTAALFSELVRPRESLFRFDSAKTVLTDNPQLKLEELYNFFVERQFARDKEYQETIMTHHLRRLFLSQAGRASMFRQGTLGNELYSVSVPFLLQEAVRPLKAIKPLDLNKETSTRIIEHGDQWLNRIVRLREIGCLPDQMLFPVDEPLTGDMRRKAAGEIVDRLEKLNVLVVPFRDEARVLEFAKTA